MRGATGFRRRGLYRWVLAGVALAALLPVHGDAELVLLDGRVLRGTTARREAENYVLTLPGGEEVTFPAGLVKEVRLVAARSEKPADAPPDPPGIRRAEAQELSGRRPEGPTGLRSEAPRTLAGPEVEPPSPSQQTAVFGEPARFQRDIVKNDWQPTTDWNMDPETQNNFAPSKWADSVVDSSWEPQSAWDTDTDVLESSRSTWSKSIIDSSWTPTDGFKKKDNR